METGLDKGLDERPEHALARLAIGVGGAEETTARPRSSARWECFHCGEPCPAATFDKGDKHFCCQGCLVVHDLLIGSGLDQFYDLNLHPGVRIRQSRAKSDWAYLDDPTVEAQLLDFSDEKISRITFYIPAIHCVACVWLLENLFRLHPGIGKCQVNFARRETTICFAHDRIPLSELVALLDSIGYKPQLTLGELERRPKDPSYKKHWLQLGIAGFCFGNIMLFSLPDYLGLDTLSGQLFHTLFGYLSLLLAIPVLVYSASDYWRSALVSLHRRVLTLDVPIALGLAALYAQSAYEILSGRGAGYLDSLAGLVFFLLCGRAFQQKTHDRLAFDRDYRSFFPLAVVRKTSSGEETIPLSSLRVGDRLVVRNGELIPADARLLSSRALIDYSFVTGESEPVAVEMGDHLYAGGQQAGSAIEIETVKAVSQSYLTSLWGDKAFEKRGSDNLNTLTNQYSRRFTLLVVLIAASAGMFWISLGDTARGIKAFASVLIVACPCALALAAPFALGTSQRLLARIQVFLKNVFVLEAMARVDAIVFDKTGTLTARQVSSVTFHARPQALDGRGLSEGEAAWVGSLAAQSIHPHAQRIRGWLGSTVAEPVQSFVETPGMGISGVIGHHSCDLGSRIWLEQAGVPVPEVALPAGSSSFLAIDGEFRGAFCFSNLPGSEIAGMLSKLGEHYQLFLLSGDNEREHEEYRRLFGTEAGLRFNQTPHDKLEFVRRLQASGQTVMMIGDGLNDAGALKQSDVGIAVVDQVGTFSPASDVILEGAQVRRLFEILKLANKTVRIVRWSFGVSAAYNLIGVSIAAAGILSPLICAVLMPLSSFSVVVFACGMSNWAARSAGLAKR